MTTPGPLGRAAGLGAHRYLALLVLLLGGLVLQPLVGERAGLARAVYESVIAAAAVTAVFAVFRRTWERSTAALLALPAVAATATRQLAGGEWTAVAGFVYAASVASFLGFAVTTIVRDIFRSGAMGGDEVVGAFAGYLMLGAAWGSLYSGVEVLAPGSFNVSPEIRWQLQDWHLRRALFTYVSYATMAGLGYNDITPTRPLSNTLTWLEVMLAQFYLAVVVAQIVGLKLARRG